MAVKTQSKAAAKKKSTAKKATKTTPSIEFKLHAPDVNEIFLAGDFNNWESNSKEYQMRKYKDNLWKKSLKLKPGRYEYQFVADGRWIADPGNPERQPNPYSTENSVIVIS